MRETEEGVWRAVVLLIPLKILNAPPTAEAGRALDSTRLQKKELYHALTSESLLVTRKMVFWDSPFPSCFWPGAWLLFPAMVSAFTWAQPPATLSGSCSINKFF